MSDTFLPKWRWDSVLNQYLVDDLTALYQLWKLSNVEFDVGVILSCVWEVFQSAVTEIPTSQGFQLRFKSCVSQIQIRFFTPCYQVRSQTESSTNFVIISFNSSVFFVCHGPSVLKLRIRGCKIQYRWCCNRNSGWWMCWPTCAGHCVTNSVPKNKLISNQVVTWIWNSFFFPPTRYGFAFVSHLPELFCNDLISVL